MKDRGWRDHATLDKGAWYREVGREVAVGGPEGGEVARIPDGGDTTSELVKHAKCFCVH